MLGKKKNTLTEEEAENSLQAEEEGKKTAYKLKKQKNKKKGKRSSQATVRGRSRDDEQASVSTIYNNRQHDNQN